MKNRADLRNVGNTNGLDVYCTKCGEPWENCAVIDDFTDEEFERFVELDSQLDDPYGPATRIARLNGCPECEEF